MNGTGCVTRGFGFAAAALITLAVAACGKSPSATTAGSGGAGGIGSAGGTSGTSIDPAASAKWTWLPCAKLPPSTANAVEVAYSPVREEVAARYDDGSIILHTVDTQVPDRVLLPPGGHTNAIAFSPDGTLLAGFTDKIGLRRIQDGQLLPQTFAPDARCEPSRLGFSPDGTRVLGWNRKAACVWNAANGQLQTVVERPFAAVTLTNDGIVAVGMSSPTTIEHLSLPDLTRTVITPDLPDGSFFLPDAVVLPPTGAGFAATVQMPTGRLLRLWDADGHSLRSVAPQNFGTLLYSANGQHVLLDGEAFNARSGASEGTPLLQETRPLLALNMTGKRGLALTELDSRSTAVVYDLPAGNEIRVFASLPRQKSRHLYDLAITPDDKFLAASSGDYVMVFQLAKDFAQSAALRSQLIGGLPFALSFSTTGDQLLASGDGFTLTNTADGRILVQTAPRSEVVNECQWAVAAISPRNTWLAVGDPAPSLSVQRLFTDNAPILSVPSARCNARAAFSRDEQFMATTGPELYRTADWQLEWPRPELVAPLPSRNSPFSDVQFAPGERELLVSTCGILSSLSDGDIYRCSYVLYDAANGTRLRELGKLSAHHAEFSSEGHWIVSGGVLQHLPSGTIRSLTITDQTPEQTPLLSIFAPNGDVIAAMPDNTLVRYCRQDGAAPP